MAQVEGAGKPLSSLQTGQTVQIRQNASGVVTGLTIDTGGGQQVLFTRQSNGSFIRVPGLFTHQIPAHTSASATAYFSSRIFSPRKMADSTVPATGTTKLNGAIMLTRLCLSSTLHSAKAIEESSVK